jgi:antitoxin component YwqK of YwqJK toxin-antitoxin module
VSWHKNGRTRSEGDFVNGKREDLWIYYRDSGKVWMKVRYRQGREAEP